MSEVSDCVPTIPNNKSSKRDLPVVVGFILKAKPDDCGFFLNSDDSITDNESMSVNIEESDSENQSERDSCLPKYATDSPFIETTDTPAPPANSRKSCFVHLYIISMITFTLFAIGNLIYRSF